MRKKTSEQFKEEVFNLVGDEYTILEKYINTRTPILMRHNSCGYEWQGRPEYFIGGNRCPQCGGTKKKTPEQFVKEVFAKVEDEYVVLEDYINKSTPILMRHISCGHEWKVQPGNFLNGGTRCPNCFGVKTITTEQFKREVNELVSTDYEVLGKYTGAYDKVEMKHIVCGHEYSVKRNDFLWGNRCPKCFGTHKRTNDEFLLKLKSMYKERYTPLEEYINSKTKIKFRCNECNNVWLTSPHSIFSNTGCPVCASSKGERAIREWLQSNDINFESEKRFSDCRNEQPLPFDFYLSDHNILIEFDGEQHYKPCGFGASSRSQMELKFAKTQHHDTIKNDYCLEKNIELVRIPYWDFEKIDDILTFHLKKVSS